MACASYLREACHDATSRVAGHRGVRLSGLPDMLTAPGLPAAQASQPIFRQSQARLVQRLRHRDGLSDGGIVDELSAAELDCATGANVRDSSLFPNIQACGAHSGSSSFSDVSGSREASGPCFRAASAQLSRTSRGVSRASEICARSDDQPVFHPGRRPALRAACGPRDQPDPLDSSLAARSTKRSTAFTTMRQQKTDTR